MPNRDNKIDFTVRVKDGEEIGKVARWLGGVESSLKGVSKESGIVGGLLGSVKAKLVALGAAITGLFSAALFAGAVRSAAEFEAAMSRVKAAAGGTDEEFKALQKAAEDAGAATKYTSVEAAGALENLAKAGLNAKESITALPAVLVLAQAGGISLGQASEYVTKAVMGMGLQFADAARVADVLAKGANASNTSVEGLAQALSYAAPLARTLGLSLETTVAIIGKFADAGIDASRAGTALNAILAQFSDPASQFRKELADAGIITGNFEKALRELAAAGPRGAKAINAVGLEAGPALRALLGQGIGALDELKGKLDDAAGSAAKTAAVMEDNLPGAMHGLASAWDTVRNVLGAPVLPVLKDAVLSFAEVLRGLVSDGTIAKFGESVAEAFRSGAKWARDFIAQIDFKAAVASMQEFAARSQEVFKEIGEHATAAGAMVKTAYGVMSGGANVVMTAIYGIAASYAEASIRIVDFAARASDALAKISFGDTKQKLIAQAQDMREVLVGLTGVRDEFVRRTLDGLDATAKSAQTARDGFASLSGGLKDTSKAGDGASAAMAAVAKELQATAEATAAAREAQEKKTLADQAAKQAAEENRAAVAALRGEYAQLVASGDLQGAAQKLQEINKALAGTPAAAAAAGTAAQEAAAQIEAAFGRMGITSSAVLKQQAENAKRDFEIIKNAGTSTAEDIAAAFKFAADKAIAANKGVAPAWVEGQAALRGYRIEVDDAGKSTLVLASATDKAGDAHRRTAGAIGEHMTALEKLNAAREREIAAQEKANQLTERQLELYRKKWNIDKDGFTLDANGQRMQQSVPTGNYVYETAKGQGLTEAQALALMDKYFKDGQGVGTVRGTDWFSTVNKAIADAVIESARKRAATGGSEKDTVPTEAANRSAPTSSATSRASGGAGVSAGASAGATYISHVQINLDRKNYGVVDTSPSGADVMQRVLRDLATAKRVAQ